MEMILALAMKFWQWTVLIAVVIIAAIINWADKRATTKMKFYTKECLSYNHFLSKQKEKVFGKELSCGYFQQETGY